MGAIEQQVAALEGLMQARRSVRGFLPDPVPRDRLECIFAMAALAPSNCNVQPWIVHVVSGAAAERMRERLFDRARSTSETQPDFPLTRDYAGDYRLRRIEAAKVLFAATGVARDDAAARDESFLRNFRFFDAPHAAFFFLPPWAGPREAADLGMYAQSLMLALTAHGLASCAQGALSHHADLVREKLGVAPGLRLLFGLAFGREDPAHDANRARTDRAPLDATTIFHD